MKRRDFVDLLKSTVQGWQEDNVSLMAAALSYYTILSLAPLLVLAIAITAQIYEDFARELITAQISRYVGVRVADAIGLIIENAQQPSAGLIAGIFGVATLLFGASGVFAQLMNAMDVIWRVVPSEERGVLGTAKDRLLAFGMVLLSGFLFLLTLAATALVTWAGQLISGLTPETLSLVPVLNIVVSLVLTTVIFAAIFKVIPRVTLVWRDVWTGALVTATLFVVGKELIAVYLRLGQPGSAYGAAGSIIVLLIFVYYSAQIFLLGAEFTKFYARRFGSQATLASGARRYRIVIEDEPTLRAVAGTLPEEEIQVVPRPLEGEGEQSPASPAEPERVAAAAAPPEERELPYVWIVGAALAFLVGIILGDRR